MDRCAANRQVVVTPGAGMTGASFCIGCAGWTIRKEHASRFPPSGSHLERYARRLNAVEINSSFYRPHRRATYERWAARVPENFAFAVKAPKAITHELRLAGAEAALDAFLDEAGGLGKKLGPLLFQFPPRFAFDHPTVRTFLTALRARFDGHIACEPRHPTWFAPEADDLLAELRVARVAADPAVVPAVAEPGGWNGLVYLRLHGSPRVYWSEYRPEEIERIARRLRTATDARTVWCIFDNTALGAATVNALALRQRLRVGRIRREAP